MPKPKQDPEATFLLYYEAYSNAKEANQRMATWLHAVRCRKQLQEMGGPSKEAETCEKIFADIVPKKEAAKIFRDLYGDSRSYPQQQAK